MEIKLILEVEPKDLLLQNPDIPPPFNGWRIGTAQASVEYGIGLLIIATPELFNIPDKILADMHRRRMLREFLREELANVTAAELQHG